MKQVPSNYTSLRLQIEIVLKLDSLFDIDLSYCQPEKNRVPFITGTDWLFSYVLLDV